MIVEAPSSYNGIMGRLTLNKLKAYVSIYPATVEIRTENEIYTIIGGRHIGRKCFMASKIETEHSSIENKLKSETESSINFQPRGESELQSISDSHPKDKSK